MNDEYRKLAHEAVDIMFNDDANDDLKESRRNLIKAELRLREVMALERIATALESLTKGARK